MTLEPQRLIDGYLDETLSPDEHAELAAWLKADHKHAQQFASAMLLHDRLRNEHLAQALNVEHVSNVLESARREPSRLEKSGHVENVPHVLATRPSHIAGTTHRIRRFAAISGMIVAASLIMAVIWRGLGETPAAAAVVEINRLIAASARSTDRTFEITVEEAGLLSHRDLADDAPERKRPPKPPLSGAILHVRRGGQFVLSRQTSDGRTFLTGSNGRASWAVRPDGSVRESTDLNEFHRDVPGHEHSMPLIHIEEGLERLLEAYDVRLLPVETTDDAVAEDNPTRLIVAVKRRHYRGPKRVEISYSVRSGLIQQLRFVEMPYGPEHLTLRMTLIEERPLGDRFFDHESHHKTDQPVIEKP